MNWRPQGTVVACLALCPLACSSKLAEAPDASGSAATADAPRDGTTSVGTFVAAGLVERTITSFDDGMSWVDDQSDMSGVICTNPGDPSQCYEGSNDGRGGAFLDGHFFATFGWYQAANRADSVNASADGKTWSPVMTPGGYGGIAAGNGAVVLASLSGQGNMTVSTDLGATWNATIPGGFSNGVNNWTNFRHVGFVNAKGGQFVFGGDGNGFDTPAAGSNFAPHVVVSHDGLTWHMPTTMPATCPSGFRLTGGFGSVGDRIIIVGPDGKTCFSDDAGDNWTLGTTIPDGYVASQDLVSTTDHVWAWSTKNAYSTTDGVTWTAAPLVTASGSDAVSVGAVSWNPDTGTFVAITSGYASGYTAQHFYRSTDGVSWDELPAANYVQSHPITSISYGRITAP